MEYKNAKQAYNSTISISCKKPFKLDKGKEVCASVVFHKSGKYRMQNKHDKEECIHNLTFCNFKNVTKYYHPSFDFIECLVIKY
jgi:hypothetical protein